MSNVEAIKRIDFVQNEPTNELSQEICDIPELQHLAQVDIPSPLKGVVSENGK